MSAANDGEKKAAAKSTRRERIKDALENVVGVILRVLLP